jgi:hypothetical protein
MITCPVNNCGKEFINRYSLTNHIKRCGQEDHNIYYADNIAKKHCQKCGRDIDYRSVNKDVCATCRKNEGSSDKKEIAKKLLARLCFKCGALTVGMFSVMNTRVMCYSCMEKYLYDKKQYNIKFDRARYDKLIGSRKAARINNKYIEKEELKEKIKDDIFNFEIPIHELCDKHNISLISIRKIIKDLMPLDVYKKRCFGCRSSAMYERMKKSSIYDNNPNKLEKRLGDEILGTFKGSKVSYRIIRKFKYQGICICTEIDIIANIEGANYAILCDGIFYHGREAHYGDTTKRDQEKSLAINGYYPYVLRYSEWEIYDKRAIEHLSDLVSEVRAGLVEGCRRNWQILEDIKVPKKENIYAGV